METQAAASNPTDGTKVDPPPRIERIDLTARIGFGVAAAILLVLAVRAPLWTSDLNAPQYPGGLRLKIYGSVAEGDVVQGDIAEITELNHYVGMKPYDSDEIPEIKLWIPTMAAALVAVVVSTIFGRRLIGRLARLGLWLIPVGVLIDIQFRLYQFGHDLVTDPRPALPLDPFTPKVIGPTKVLNFTNTALPGIGLAYVWLAAALVTFGPWVVHKVASRETQPAVEETAGASPA